VGRENRRGESTEDFGTGRRRKRREDEERKRKREGKVELD
jgi:hypothetical protein